MKRYFIIILLFCRIEKLFQLIKYKFDLLSIRSLEKKCGCRINYVEQGFNGIKIISATGDFTKFKIDITSHLKSDTLIECSGGVRIGKYFHPGRGLTIFSTNHNYESNEMIPYDSKIIEKPVIIKDFVWCGANVTIVPGVTIGEGVVIGAGTVVTKNVPDYAIIGGNPHKIKKYRNKEVFLDLKRNAKYY